MGLLSSSKLREARGLGEAGRLGRCRRLQLAAGLGVDAVHSVTQCNEAQGWEGKQFVWGQQQSPALGSIGM